MRADPAAFADAHGLRHERRRARRETGADRVIVIGDVAERADHCLFADLDAFGSVEHRAAVDVGARADLDAGAVIGREQRHAAIQGRAVVQCDARRAGRAQAKRVPRFSSPRAGKKPHAAGRRGSGGVFGGGRNSWLRSRAASTPGPGGASLSPGAHGRFDWFDDVRPP